MVTADYHSVNEPSIYIVYIVEAYQPGSYSKINGM